MKILILNQPLHIGFDISVVQRVKHFEIILKKYIKGSGYKVKPRDLSGRRRNKFQLNGA